MASLAKPCRYEVVRQCDFWMHPSRRVASSATLLRTLPSSSQQWRSRLRRLNTSCLCTNPIGCRGHARNLPVFILQERVNAQIRPPVENPLIPFVSPLTQRTVVPTFSLFTSWVTQPADRNDRCEPLASSCFIPSTRTGQRGTFRGYKDSSTSTGKLQLDFAEIKYTYSHGIAVPNMAANGTLRRPTVDISNTIASLMPLVWSFRGWLARHVDQTMQCGSVCLAPGQVQWHLLYLVGYFTSSPCGNCGPISEGSNRACPSSEMEKGFYSHYFIVLKKGSGKPPFQDLWVLNWALDRLLFKLRCIHQQDWFVAHTVHSCFDLASAQTVSLVRLQRSSISVQGPSGCPCLLKSSRKSQRLPFPH